MHFYLLLEKKCRIWAEPKITLIFTKYPVTPILTCSNAPIQKKKVNLNEIWHTIVPIK